MVLPDVVSTPYQNTISAADEPDYPGDEVIEQRIEEFVRWNAMAMVVKATCSRSSMKEKAAM